MLLASADATLLTFTGTLGLDRGYAKLDLPLRFTPTGLRVFAQWLWLDPANPALHGSTDGHEFRVQ
jgi:hypothetical protein